jgi:hypothetical protein
MKYVVFGWARSAGSERMVQLAGSDDVLRKDSVCFIDIPVNKTSPAFTNRSIDRWVRP